MHLDHMIFQVLPCAEHDEFLVKTSAPFAWVVFLREMSFLRARLVDRINGSVGGTINQRLEVLEADDDQSLPRASYEAYSLFMQGSVSFADETFFMFLTHMGEQFVIPEGTFTAELAHRVSFDVNNAFRFLRLSAGLSRW